MLRKVKEVEVMRTSHGPNGWMAVLVVCPAWRLGFVDFLWEDHHDGLPITLAGCFRKLSVAMDEAPSLVSGPPREQGRRWRWGPGGGSSF